MAIRKRGRNHYEVVVYAGLDPATGKQRQISRTVRGSREDAKAKERELADEALLDRGQLRTIPFGVLTSRWLKVARHEKSTRYQTDYYLRKHILPRWKQVNIGEIRPADLDAWYLGLELAPTTIRRIHGIIAAALEQAVRWEWLDFNPARRASPPEGSRRPPTVPSGEQVFAALERLRGEDSDLWAFVRVSAATGMRRGEVCGLRDSDVIPGLLRVSRAIGEEGGAHAYEKPTKTQKPRLIALDRRTEAVVRWQAWRMRTRIRTIYGKNAPQQAGTGGDFFLFSGADDCQTPWTPNSVSKRFRRIVGPGINLGHLRHFVASELIAAGVDLKVVSGRLGHARTSTTLDIYASLMPESDWAAAQVIGRKLEKPKKQAGIGREIR